MWRAVTFLAFVTPTLGDPILTTHLGSYQQPSHSSPYAQFPRTAPLNYGSACPYVEAYRIACRKADKVCCLPSTFTTAVDDTFPFLQQTCPVTDAVTADNICAALDANSTFVEPGTRLLPAGQITTTGNWVSDRHAAIAAIGSADLCFNIYPHIMPGDVLQFSCENSFIGLSFDALSNLGQGASISTGGNLVIQANSGLAAPPNFLGAVIVLGDLTVLETPNANTGMASTTEFTGPGAFNNMGVLVGGQVTVVPAVSITVNNGDTFVSDAAFSGVFTNGATVLSSGDIEMLRNQFDAYLCSAFNQILALDDNGTPVFSVAGSMLELDCDGGGDGLCVMSITGFQLLFVSTITVTLNGYSSVLVRVRGGGTQSFTMPHCNAVGACGNALFVFTEADAVNLSATLNGALSPILPLFAPVATAVNMNWLDDVTLESAIIIAPSGSTITLSDAGSMPIVTAVDDDLRLPDVTVYDVIFCSCACDPSDLPIHKEEKQCIKTPYGYGHSDH